MVLLTLKLAGTGTGTVTIESFTMNDTANTAVSDA